MATLPALVGGDKQAHSPSHNTATDPPPGDASYFPVPQHHPPSETPSGAHTPLARVESPISPSTPTGPHAVDYNTTAPTPDDIDIPGLLFAIPYPTPLNAAPKKDRPSFLLYAPPRAAYRRPPDTPDGKKGKEKLVKKIERNWQEEVDQGKKIGKGDLPDATKWQKTKGLFTRKASQAIQWLPDSNIEALSRVPPKSKMHQVLVFIPEDPTTKEIQDATGGRVASRLELEKQLQVARSKAIKRSAISGALLPVTGVIDVLCPIPLFAFEIDAAYFTSQYQGLRKASAMTSDVRLALEPTPHLAALSERLLQICYKLAPKQFPNPSGMVKTVVPGTPMGLLSPSETSSFDRGVEAPRLGQEKDVKDGNEWYPEYQPSLVDEKAPVQATKGVPPPLPPRPSAAPKVEEPTTTLTDDEQELPAYTDPLAPLTSQPEKPHSSIPPPLPPRPPTGPSAVSLAPTQVTDPFTDTHHADRASTKTADPFNSPHPSSDDDGYSVTYTNTLGGGSSHPNTAPNTPASAWIDPSETRAASPEISPSSSAYATPTSGTPTDHPPGHDHPSSSTEQHGPSTSTSARQPPPRAPPLPTAARALAEAVIRQVRAAVSPAVAERHALDDVGELARDIERCMEKGAREFVKTL